MFKIYKAKFNTSELTKEQLQAKFDVLENAVVELITTALHNVHDIELAVAEWDYSPGGFSIVGHNEDENGVDMPLK